MLPTLNIDLGLDSLTINEQTLHKCAESLGFILNENDCDVLKRMIYNHILACVHEDVPKIIEKYKLLPEFKANV